jgi:hypothetical protein
MTIWKIPKPLKVSVLLVINLVALTTFAQVLRADEPVATGLWQKTEAGKPVAWILIFERDGSYFKCRK